MSVTVLDLVKEISKMKKQSEVKEKTKRKLMDAFWELYCHTPIHKITVREITEKAGYNRGTFYEYFLDVYDVLEKIEVGLIDEVEKYPLHNGFSKKEDTPVEISLFLGIFEKHNKYFSVLLGENGDPSFQAKLSNSIKPKLKNMIIGEGIEDSAELDLVLDYNISAMNGVLCAWFRMDYKMPIENFVSLITDLTTGGTFAVLKNID